MTTEPLSHRARLQLLMMKVIERDEAAFGELSHLMGPVIFRTSQAVIQDPHKSSEVTQEVLFEIWQKARTFDADLGLVYSWIKTIAYRRADDRAVSEERAARHDFEYFVRQFTREYDQTSDTALDAVDHRRVRALLPLLSEPQHEAITLAFYGGLTYEQVAARQAVPVPTAKSRIRDGIAVLRKELDAPVPVPQEKSWSIRMQERRRTRCSR